MYAMGEILRYQTLKREEAPLVRDRCCEGCRHPRHQGGSTARLCVSGRGNGFPCRSYMLTSEAEAQIDSRGLQCDGFWFGMEMLEEGEAYPDPIIDELKQEGQDPDWCVATVRPPGMHCRREAPKSLPRIPTIMAWD